MKKYDLLVIGGDAAGMSAASQARRMNNDISIAVFDKGNHVSYAACGMPYYIAGDIKNSDDLIAIDRDNFVEKRNIMISSNSEATSVDFKSNTVTILEQGENKIYGYEKLVIATGAHAFVPPIEGINSENVFMLRNLADGISIKENISKNRPGSAVIIGGGFIGLEMAEAFTRLSIKTTILERMESVAMTMSDEIRELIRLKIEENGVEIKAGENIQSIEQDDNSIVINTDTGRIRSDLVLVSVGVLPNTGFLRNSGISMTERGAIIIDEHSRTSIPGVYAAGDCATVKHIITGKDTYMPMGSTANKQGRVAGLHATGVNNERFNGIAGSQFVKIFDLEVGKTGFNSTDAEKNGISSETRTATWKSRAGYCPMAQKIFISITIDSQTRKIIGGEIAGSDGAALRTNVIAAAITSGMSIDEFAYLDLGYAPPFSPVWDPLNGTAQKFLIRKTDQ